MSQQFAPSTVESPAAQRLRTENAELQRYLEAQQKVISSLERRVGRSLESLGVQLDHLSQSLHDLAGWQVPLSRVQNDVDSLCDLLTDAMVLQKLEAGKVEVRLEALSLGLLLDSVTRHLLDPKSVHLGRLICEFAPSLPAVLADQDLTEAVLGDLLARSLRYSDTDCPVILGAKQIGNCIQLSITAQRFAPVGNRDFATEIVLCCRRVEVQNGTITCQQAADGLQTVAITLAIAS